MIKITEDVYINKEDLVSIQREETVSWHGSPSDSYPVKDFSGSVLTLKNGRKIYVKGLYPQDIMELLK